MGHEQVLHSPNSGVWASENLLSESPSLYTMYIMNMQIYILMKKILLMIENFSQLKTMLTSLFTCVTVSDTITLREGVA